MTHFKTITEKDIKELVPFAEKIGKEHLSFAFRKNKNATFLNTLNDLCNIIQCEVSNIIRFFPDIPEK